MAGRLSSKKNTLFIVILLTAVLVLFAVISYLFFDKYALDWLARNPNSFDNILLIDVIVLLGKVWIPIWLLFCWALFTGRRQETMAALIAIIILSIIVPLLKDAFNRSRPRDVIGQQVQNNEDLPLYKCSFPSGDTASIFAIGAAIIPYIGWLEGGVIFLLAIVVGILRVGSTAHYPSDVFAGAAIGILTGYAVFLMTEKFSWFKEHLINILNPPVLLITIIMIPLMEGLFGRRREIILFLKFYLPAAIIAAVIYKFVKKRKNVRNKE
jgi:membrane-associated phospholipid phosphatase